MHVGMVRSRHAPTVPETKLGSIVHTRSVAETMVQSLLLKIGFVVPIVGIRGKKVRQSSGDHDLHDIKAASATFPDNDLFTQAVPPDLTSSLTIPSVFKSHKGSCRGCCHRDSLLCWDQRKKSVSNGHTLMYETDSDHCFQQGSSWSRKSNHVHYNRSANYFEIFANRHLTRQQTLVYSPGLPQISAIHQI